MPKKSETGTDSGYEFVPPTEVDKEVDKDNPNWWLEITTWRIWVKCADGRTLWRTVTIDSNWDPEGFPGSTPEEITKYHAWVKKKNMEIDGRLASEIAGLRLECTQFAIPDRRHVGGQDHSAVDYRGGVKCWCTVDHGPHDYLGGITCWCGEHNDYIGIPR